jgi:catechol 2,3-dioxygenase-like lactoylglutathione lyase family enzyme
LDKSRGKKLVSEKEKNSLDAIDHIAISVEDIDKAINWYSQQFKCVVEYQDDTWAYLKFENIRLALVVPGQHPAHVAFAVDNAEQYGELKTHRDGTRSVYVWDPAGNTVELVDSNSTSAPQVDH